jgi:hypothetical protein
VQSIKEPFQNSWLNLQPNLDHLSVFLWLGFKVGASNGVYKVNISMYLKKKNDVISCIPLDAQILNLDHEINGINFI